MSCSLATYTGLFWSCRNPRFPENETEDEVKLAKIRNVLYKLLEVPSFQLFFLAYYKQKVGIHAVLFWIQDLYVNFVFVLTHSLLLEGISYFRLKHFSICKCWDACLDSRTKCINPSFQYLQISLLPTKKPILLRIWKGIHFSSATIESSQGTYIVESNDSERSLWQNWCQESVRRCIFEASFSSICPWSQWFLFCRKLSEFHWLFECGEFDILFSPFC